MPVHSGQAPNGELNENVRGSMSSSAIGCSFGQAIFSLNRRSRSGPSGSSTNSATSRPLASPSAVSTESVSRCLALRLTASRSTTTSMVCLSFFSSAGGSASCTTWPSTRARAKPFCCSSRNRSAYSPLRARTTGASTWNRVPSGSSSSRSTICCGVCRVIASPQTGQCGVPARAHSRRR